MHFRLIWLFILLFYSRCLPACTWVTHTSCHRSNETRIRRGKSAVVLAFVFEHAHTHSLSLSSSACRFCSCVWCSSSLYTATKRGRRRKTLRWNHSSETMGATRHVSSRQWPAYPSMKVETRLMLLLLLRTENASSEPTHSPIYSLILSGKRLDQAIQWLFSSFQNATWLQPF